MRTHLLDGFRSTVRVSAWSPGAALFAVLLAGCATAANRQSEEDANCAWRACIRYTDSRAGRTYRIESKEPVPVTVRLTFTLIRLNTVDRQRSIGADPSVAIDLGSDSTIPDADHLYSVPFGGDLARQLVQGFDGADTHLGGMRYSLDFAMPEGTPVLAARVGIVVHVQDGFTEGGTDPDLLERANIVVVGHSDGTLASYGHLAPGIAVDVGQRVEEDERLASSGATGFAGQPHLHFHVGKRLLGDPHRTIPIQFKDQQGEVLRLETGSMIAPAQGAPPR